MWANEDIDGLNLMFTPPGEAPQSGGAWEHRSVRSAQGPTPPFIASTLQRFNAPPPVILGVPFDNVTLGEAVRRVEAMIASRRPHYAVTANVDFLVQARHDLELRRIDLRSYSWRIPIFVMPVLVSDADEDCALAAGDHLACIDH